MNILFNCLVGMSACFLVGCQQSSTGHETQQTNVQSNFTDASAIGLGVLKHPAKDEQEFVEGNGVVPEKLDEKQIRLAFNKEQLAKLKFGKGAFVIQSKTGEFYLGAMTNRRIPLNFAIENALRFLSIEEAKAQIDMLPQGTVLSFNGNQTVIDNGQNLVSLTPKEILFLSTKEYKTKGRNSVSPEPEN